MRQLGMTGQIRNEAVARNEDMLGMTGQGRKQGQIRNDKMQQQISHQ